MFERKRWRGWKAVKAVGPNRFKDSNSEPSLIGTLWQVQSQDPIFHQRTKESRCPSPLPCFLDSLCPHGLYLVSHVWYVFWTFKPTGLMRWAKVLRQARRCLQRQNQQGQECFSMHPKLVIQSVDVKFQGSDFTYASMVPMHPSGSYTSTDKHHSCYCVILWWLQMPFILSERCLVALSFRPHSSPKTGHPLVLHIASSKSFSFWGHGLFFCFVLFFNPHRLKRQYEDVVMVQELKPSLWDFPYPVTSSMHQFPTNLSFICYIGGN